MAIESFKCDTHSLLCMSTIGPTMVRIYRKCIRHSFFLQSTKGPTMVWLVEKVFKAKVLRWLENAIMTSVFANTVNTSYTFFNSHRSTI